MTGMYKPRAFSVEERSIILDVLRDTAFGHLVTNSGSEGSPSGLTATALPFIVDDDVTALRAHFARANDHWKLLDGANALMIVSAIDAYISPRWYPSKAEHGKVVPTWNYELVHLHGTIEIHDDPDWTLDVVRDLTDHNEQQVIGTKPTRPWEVDDAPAEFIAAQLKAIVGFQLTIERIDAKRKLSQNRSQADRTGVIEGLSQSQRRQDVETAASMKSVDRVSGVPPRTGFRIVQDTR